MKETIEGMKRFAVQGWDSKPAYLRAGFWFVLGTLALALFQSYQG